MATSSIDLQCEPQIKPQDKRLGRRTMDEHSGPHGGGKKKEERQPVDRDDHNRPQADSF